MDVFQTDWKERHEHRGNTKPPTLLDVWKDHLGQEDESEALQKINVPTIFHPDQGNTYCLYFLSTRPDNSMTFPQFRISLHPTFADIVNPSITSIRSFDQKSLRVR